MQDRGRWVQTALLELETSGLTLRASISSVQSPFFSYGRLAFLTVLIGSLLIDGCG